MSRKTHNQYDMKKLSQKFARILQRNKPNVNNSFNLKSIIRVMPNTPAQIGYGMSVWSSTSYVSEKIKNFTRDILESLGDQVYVKDENYLIFNDKFHQPLI